jgi:transposase
VKKKRFSVEQIVAALKQIELGLTVADAARQMGWRAAAIGTADLEAIAKCACTIAAKKGAVAPCSWAPEESRIESCEHQDNANVRYQPFPESVSEEREIYTDYDGYHCHHVKRDSDLSTRFRLHGLYRNGRNEFPGNRYGPVSFATSQWLKLGPSSLAGRRD